MAAFVQEIQRINALAVQCQPTEGGLVLREKYKERIKSLIKIKSLKAIGYASFADPAAVPCCR
jgi:hypothetical protein